MKEKIILFIEFLGHSKKFILLNLSALGTILLLRFYEFAVLSMKQTTPGVECFGKAFFYDLRFSFSAFFLLGLLYFPLSRHHKKTAIKVHGTLLLCWLFLHVALEKYFAITLNPLGAEVFSYTLHDITRTVRSSSEGLGILDLLLFLSLALMGTITWFWIKSQEKILGNGKKALVFMATSLAFFLVLLGMGPALHDPVASNKTEYFISKSWIFFANKTKAAPAISNAEFPLLRFADDDDVLGDYFNLREIRPNIVILVVEGLGHTMTEKGRHGGFTPFLDSLAKDGLSWKNFLSTSGRTFGLLPSLLSSLPHADQGLMSLESSMPHHLSLLGLLKENGYNTRFFHGSNASFDQMRSYLNRHEIDLLVDQFYFSKESEAAEKDEGGFSWGYSDGALFKRALEEVSQENSGPFFDLYLTITTHEPFIPPRKEHYLSEFEKRLASLNPSDEVRTEMQKNASVFSTFLYTDEAIRDFFTQYKKLPTYANTIFVITGDHRMIPVQERNAIDRYHVPFIIYSPLLKGPQEFPAVSTHLDFVPSLLALLKNQYPTTLPEKVHWLGIGLDTHSEFRSTKELAFMRAKDGISDYLRGDRYLSGEKLFALTDGMVLDEILDKESKSDLKQMLTKYRQMSVYVCDNDKIYPGSGKKKTVPLGQADLTYENARKFAYEKDYEKARQICQEMLKVNPNYHDVRALLGRTYAWEKNYIKAREIYNELIKMAPEYPDGHAALAYLEYWSGNLSASETLISKALELHPRGEEYLMLKARLLKRSNKSDEALVLVNSILEENPSSQEALEFKKSLAP